MCNAVRHGLTAETVIGGLEDAEDYKAFEAAVIADYDAKSAVERELVLRLASLLLRLRRATTMETGLFEIQANHLNEFRQAPPSSPSNLKQAPALGAAALAHYPRSCAQRERYGAHRLAIYVMRASAGNDRIGFDFTRCSHERTARSGPSRS
jgi:hypothetical protein